MKTPKKVIASLLALASFSAINGAQAQEGAPVPAQVPAFNLNSPALNQKGQAFRVSPDENSWREYLETLRVYLSDGRVYHSPYQSIVQHNPSLKDLQARVIDAGGARIWTFPGVQTSHNLVIQSGGSSADGAPSARASIVEIPSNVNVTTARIVRSFTTTTKPVKVGRKKVVQKVVKVEGPSLLAVAGLDRNTGLVYLTAYKPVQGTWVGTAEPFSQIPSHFLQSLSGQASFSGNDLVLSVSSQNAGTTPTDTKLPKPKSSSYQIVMKFTGGHFVLAGNPGKDMPLSVVSYFVQCVRLNRLDLAKAWIADPQLISIPKYAGIVGKNGEPFKLVAMSQPLSGGSRYRLVTNQKHDLILDVGKVKKDILVKGIFIAPPDPLARSLSGTLIGGVPPAAPEGNSTPATSSGEKQEHHQ